MSMGRQLFQELLDVETWVFNEVRNLYFYFIWYLIFFTDSVLQKQCVERLYSLLVD